MHDTNRRITPSGLSLEEAAIYVGVSYPDIIDLIKAGQLAVSNIRSRQVIRRAALDRLLHESEVASQ